MAIGTTVNPSDLLVALGYTGWAQGQLEREIAMNAWLPVPADEKIIFDTAPDQKRPIALSQMGFDFMQLSAIAGHA